MEDDFWNYEADVMTFMLFEPGKGLHLLIEAGLETVLRYATRVPSPQKLLHKYAILQCELDIHGETWQSLGRQLDWGPSLLLGYNMEGHGNPWHD